MKQRKTKISLLAGSIMLSMTASAQNVVFNTTTIENDLQGDFEAMISYAQNITIPHNNTKGDPRPHLTALRDTLLMVQPVADMPIVGNSVSVIGRDSNNNILGELNLATPEQLPAHDGHDNNIVYATDMWSVTLPASWMQPGLTLEISSGGRTGQLIDLEIGAPNQLMVNTMDLGMLTAPRDRFDFMKDTKYHEDYFQKIPVSKLIVNPYESVKLDEVMLPTGVLLTEYDPSMGTWHQGDMREYISKVLIAHGINNANYGINASGAKGKGHPFTSAQLTAVTPVGRYKNGVVVHGGSGGAGMVTLTNTLGNEWSHEIGHNFGLGHYPGGTDGSTHRPSTDINSAWGWDLSQQRFIANFMWNKKTGEDQVCCSDGIGIPAFEGYKFNRDAMAGGEPSSPISKYTLHTPYVLSDIQAFLENKAVFDETSESGFKKWNSATKQMEEYTQPPLVEFKTIASQSELDTLQGDTQGEVLAGYISKYDVLSIQTYDGRWIRDIYLPNAQEVALGKQISVSRYSGYGVTVHVNGESLNLNRGDTKYYVNDNYSWVEFNPDDEISNLPARVPSDFGVPVTTLVGYYDPTLQLDSYLFPALHGAYGFVYEPTKLGELNTQGCYVKVYNGKNHDTDNYQLTGFRYDANLMNKLHINVRQSDDPTKAEIICDNNVLSTLQISKPTQPLEVSIVQSDSLNPNQPDNNTPPVANAGSDQLVNSGSTVTLSGLASTDIDGDSLSYQWQQVAGDPVTIRFDREATAEVVLPDSAKSESYTFMLTVSDGKASTTDTVIISATPNLIENSAPNVTLPASLNGNSGQSVDVKASASDEDGDALSYRWNTSGLAYQVTGEGAIRVTLPEVQNDKTYSISVVVADPHGAQSQATMRLNVKAMTDSCDVNDPNASNHPQWSSSQTYVGGNTVSYNGLVWKAKHWNRNNQPDTSTAWELLSDVSLPWSSERAYAGGDVVTYQGVKYQAKWWTKGERPDASGVWAIQGPAC
ncbi:peptidase M66 [Vibrio xuii]|nr:peptidase M66 [Vibrio xuii]